MEGGDDHKEEIRSEQKRITKKITWAYVRVDVAEDSVDLSDELLKSSSRRTQLQ